MADAVNGRQMRKPTAEEVRDGVSRLNRNKIRGVDQGDVYTL
jgi:hypothetical protein